MNDVAFSGALLAFACGVWFGNALWGDSRGFRLFSAALAIALAVAAVICVVNA